MNQNSVLIVGAGPMAVAYAKVLQEMKTPFTAIGRGEVSAQQFALETGTAAVPGGLETWLRSGAAAPKRAIVALSESSLGTATLALLEKGTTEILVEKPGGCVPSEIRKIAEEAKRRKANVRVGYNRRFYASTQKARSLIAEDGGVSSFQFEFTEWGHVVSKKVCPQGVKDEWFLHNSTHVVDLAFYLGGKPRELSCQVAGSTDWRVNRPAKYVGSGVTEAGALFSYHANWAAPGRWVLEVLTPKNRYIFKPVEKLHIQKLGTVAVEEVPIEDELDKKFKPGLFLQTEAFLNGKDGILPTIAEQAANLSVYEEIEPR